VHCRSTALDQKDVGVEDRSDVVKAPASSSGETKRLSLPNMEQVDDTSRLARTGCALQGAVRIAFLVGDFPSSLCCAMLHRLRQNLNERGISHGPF
jgi:hypothetical protein